MPNRQTRRRAAANHRKVVKAAKRIAAQSAPSRVAGRGDRRLALTVPVKITAAAAAGERETFAIEAYTGEPLNLYRFELPVVIDCASIDLSEQMIPALLDHMDFADCVVGQIEAVRVAGTNGTPPIIANGYFTPTDDPRDAARFVLAKAKAGFQWQASVGGDPGKLERIEAGQSANVNGRTYPGPVFISRGTVLREISFVVLGADRRTSAVLARRIQGSAAMDFDAWLLTMGFEDQASLTPVQLANLQKLYDAEMAEGDVPADAAAATTAGAVASEPTPPSPPANAAARRPAIQAARQPARDPVVDRRNAEADEEDRITQIRARVTKRGVTEVEIGEGQQKRKVNLVAHAIREGWTPDQTELAALQAARPEGPGIIVRSQDRDCTMQALQGAMILRARGRLDNPAYQSQQALAMDIPAWLRAGINNADRNRHMEAAHRYSDMSMVDLCREACRIDGRDAPSDRSGTIRAAMSGGTLTNIFTTNVNTQVLSTYLEAGDTTGGWTRETDVADFKTNERPRMTKGPGLVKLPRGGEADHVTRSDVGESYKISRYARQFVMDEQDFIDDAFNALADMPGEMGLAAARLRPDIVYAILLANPTLAATAHALFNSTEANLKTTSALSAATLKVASTAMGTFQESGVNLNLRPTHLIVPQALRYTGKELLASTQIVLAGTAGTVTERGNANTLADDGVQLVSDARLDNGVTDPSSGTTYSGSATTWYIACAIAKTIEVAYLRGTGRAPQVRSFVLDKGKWGLGWDVKHDIGAKALDWRGFVQNTA